MRLAAFATAIGLVTLSSTALTAQTTGTDAEKKAVRVALEHYLAGHATGDGAHYRLAFQDSANLYFVRDGQFRIWPSRDYAASASGKPAEDEAQRKRRIDFIDVTGTAAVARITLEYPGVTLTDYMSLVKIGNEWKIVSKIFDANRKQ